MKINNYWIAYFIIKLFYLFFALFIISHYTTLGDMQRWTNIDVRGDFFSIFLNESLFMDYFGALCSYILGSTFASVPFLVLSFYGIYYSISKLNINNSQLVFLLFLLSFPSFGIWTSIAGKEAFGVFFMGIICGYIIDLYKYKRYKVNVIEIIAFYLLWLFKVQYSLAIVPLIVFIIISKKTNIHAIGKLFLFFIYVFFTITILYLLKDIINEISLIIPNHFRETAGSARENVFFVEDYDIFYNMFYGMFLSFIGSTFEEAFVNPINFFIFFESIIILSFFIYFLFSFIRQIILTGKLNITVLSLLIITLFGILFVNYPLGVLNIGSAIRYRENFYGFFVVFIYFLYLELQKYNYNRKIKL
ncbi:hypothetical protein NG744_05030 [Aliarcobacter cryaerophilus]|uniref:hypothetical protein n=1 Tax=Aliarcobacter cryaerophilus TaxID=28198 RepID=UPI003DA4E28A